MRDGDVIKWERFTVQGGVLALLELALLSLSLTLLNLTLALTLLNLTLTLSLLDLSLTLALSLTLLNLSLALALLDLSLALLDLWLASWSWRSGGAGLERSTWGYETV